jgi:heat-inducible transcriptional repressor
MTTELGERSEHVLAEAVRAHVETGEPVSARSIVRRHPEPLSPATIRNVMADLEDAGFLYQPHTSAGRVPTAAGYRYFIDHFAGHARLSSSDERWIRDEISSAASVEQAFERAGHILATVSHGLGMILPPPLARLPIEHVRFLLVPDGRVLMVLIAKGGATRDKLIAPAHAFTQEELDRIAGHLNGAYSGWTIEAIRAHLSERLQREQDSYGQLAGRALELCDPALLADDGGRQLYVEGAAEIAATPEFSHPKRLSALLGAIEEKRRLIELLSSCVEAPEAVLVRIGVSEMATAGPSLALVSARFRVRDEAPGTLAILGPLRMDYERVITAAAFLAERVGSTLCGAKTL